MQNDHFTGFVSAYNNKPTITNSGNSLVGTTLTCTPDTNENVSEWVEINKKYSESYFSKYKNIWHHSDYAESTENNGYIIYGRSDATLNSGGIRIGTAELYRVVENIHNVIECVAVEQKYNNDTRILLFVKLKDNIQLDERFIKIIKDKIKSNLSPKHIPAKIINVLDIPKTKSGKIVELTVKRLINNEEIKNFVWIVGEYGTSKYKI